MLSNLAHKTCHLVCLLRPIDFGRISGAAGLELQREAFQHHFDDLVSFSVPRLRIFRVTFAENAHASWRSFVSFCASLFFPIFSVLWFLSFLLFLLACLAACLLVRACERSEAKRGRCVVEAAPQARPEDHFEAISVLLLCLDTTWDLLVLYNIARTIVLSVFRLLRFSAFLV